MLTIHYKITGKKSFIYRVKGTEKELEQYCEDQGSNLVEEDNGTPLFFISRWSDFMPSGTRIVAREDEDSGEVRYWPEETEQSIIARQALEKMALRTFGASTTPRTEDNEDDEEESEKPADMEKPAPAKVSKPRRKIGGK